MADLRWVRIRPGLRTAAGRRFLDWWQGREYVTVMLDWAETEVAAIEAEAAQFDVKRLHAALDTPEVSKWLRTVDSGTRLHIAMLISEADARMTLAVVAPTVNQRQNELDPQVGEHYERGLGRKGRGKPISEVQRARAVEAAIKYLRSDWPSVVREIEREAVAAEEQHIEALASALDKPENVAALQAVLDERHHRPHGCRFCEQTCGELLGKGPATCQLPLGHRGYHEYVHTSPVKIENSQTNEEAFGFEPRW